jgi:hypothetical protein
MDHHSSVLLIYAFAPTLLQVMTLSGQDRAVYDTVTAVMHMRKSDKALLSPQMVFKVLASKVNNWWKQITTAG